MPENISNIAKYNIENGTHFWKLSQVNQHKQQKAAEEFEKKHPILASFTKSAQDARDAKIGAVGAGQVRDLYNTGNSALASELNQKYLGANATGILNVPIGSEIATYGLLGGGLRLGAGTATGAAGSWLGGKAGDLADKQFGTNWIGTAGRIGGGFAGFVPGMNAATRVLRTAAGKGVTLHMPQETFMNLRRQYFNNAANRVVKSLDKSPIKHIPIYHGTNYLGDDLRWFAGGDAGLHVGTTSSPAQAFIRRPGYVVREGFVEVNPKEIVKINEDLGGWNRTTFDTQRGREVLPEKINNVIKKSDPLDYARDTDKELRRFKDLFDINPTTNEVDPEGLSVVSNYKENYTLANELSNNGIKIIEYPNEFEGYFGNTSLMITDPKRYVFAKHRLYEPIPTSPQETATTYHFDGRMSLSKPISEAVVEDGLFSEHIPIVKRDNFRNPDIRYKQGGMIKAQNGAELTKWINNWYINRPAQFNNYVMFDQNTAINRSNSINEKYEPWDIIQSVIPNSNDSKSDMIGGYYKKSTNTLHLPNTYKKIVNGVVYEAPINPINLNPSNYIHEKTHGIFDWEQKDQIEGILGNQMKDAYYDSPTEVNSRLMEIRYLNGFDPKHIFNKQEVEQLKKNPNFKDRDIFNRYDSETVVKLLNEVASNQSLKNNLSEYSKQGGVLKAQNKN